MTVNELLAQMAQQQSMAAQWAAAQNTARQAYAYAPNSNPFLTQPVSQIAAEARSGLLIEGTARREG